LVVADCSTVDAQPQDAHAAASPGAIPTQGKLSATSEDAVEAPRLEEPKGDAPGEVQTSRNKGDSFSSSEGPEVADQPQILGKCTSVGSADTTATMPQTEKRAHFDDTKVTIEVTAAPPMTAVRSVTNAPVSAARSLGKRITKRMTRRRTTLHTAAKRLPAPVVPINDAPLFTQRLPKATIAGLRNALARTEHCPLIRFLREVMSCYDICTTDWRDSADVADTKVRQSHYMMPVPRDVPEIAARLLRIPDTITGTTVWRLHGDSKQLLLVQHSYTKDVLYGDRFKLQNMMSFLEDPEGGVRLSSWTDVLWLTPLPWTHGVIKHVIEKRAKADSASVTGELARLIQDSAQ